MMNTDSMNDDDEHDDGVTRGLFVMKRAGDCEKDEKWDEKKRKKIT